jgi:hypothetical protein
MMPRKKDLTLRVIAIRLKTRDIDRAREIARKLGGISYQQLIRSWVTVAAAAESARLGVS